MTIQHHVLSPDELAMVQRVFKSIVREPWFDRTAENEQQFASMVMHKFQRGVIVENTLHSMCEHSAKERFSKQM